VFLIQDYQFRYKKYREPFIKTTILFCALAFSINVFAMLFLEPQIPRYTGKIV
jgi:hypothetical protein